MDSFKQSESGTYHQQHQFKKNGILYLYVWFFCSFCQHKPHQNPICLTRSNTFLLREVQVTILLLQKFGARWIDDKKNCKTVFDKVKLKLAINYTLDKSYFTVENSTSREVIGLPMGPDPTPFMEYLFLYYFENK